MPSGIVTPAGIVGRGVVPGLIDLALAPGSVRPPNVRTLAPAMRAERCTCDDASGASKRVMCAGNLLLARV